MGILAKPASDYNPQANAIIEREHQVLGNALRTFALENSKEPFLRATAYAIRSTFHTTLQTTRGQLVFGSNMIFPQLP